MLRPLPFTCFNDVFVMRHLKSLFLLAFLLVFAVTVNAQERNIKLTIQVTSVDGDDLKEQPITLIQDDYQVSYGTLKLNEQGSCSLKVYPGNHTLTIERSGFELFSKSFVVESGITESSVEAILLEKTRKPFALKADIDHDVNTGNNSISLSWNTEEPAFFDDFESYTPFAINFGMWTGIDADLEAAAPLVGSYPNRGVMQYAQIINPLTVTPTWWYDYPILRPYSGQQYVGFTRTNSGNANDDWLISPVVTVGTDNVLSFYAKAADQYPERFMVYVTTVTDNPVQSDFVRLDKDNYETSDYKSWKKYEYNLSAYAGKQVKFAIRYISHYNNYGSFMLMVDDVYVGQHQIANSRSKVLRAVKKSAHNPNEKFNIYLDNELKATTTDYEYVLENVASGEHTIGIQAVYLKAKSEMATIQVNVLSDNYAKVTLNVTADSKISADGQTVSMLNKATAMVYEQIVTDGKVVFMSLPKADYVVSIAEGAFNAYQYEVTIGKDMSIDINLTDHVIEPYNITASLGEDGIYTLRWNQELIFSDSFEDYEDFATGSFGEWLSIDVDKRPVYPIALGSLTNIVSFPGSGTAANPMPIAPMVFNPWHTVPAMLPTDKAIAAPTGDKSVVFFSSEQAASDDWLISPLLDIHEGYKLKLKAKAYDSMYPESFEFCVSDGSTVPADFKVLSYADNISAGQWALYTVDLADYAGKTVRLAVHYKSYDAFLAQIDDFVVGPENGQGEIVDYGNVVRFDISLDGEKLGEASTPQYRLPLLSEGEHTVGIKAVYKSGESKVVTYILKVTSGITHVALDYSRSMQVYSLSGVYVGNSVENLPNGVYLVRQDNQMIKIRK